MITERRRVTVSRPTFAELSAAIGKSGMTDLLTEDGTILLGAVELQTKSDVPQPARLAAAIADAATPAPNGAAIYEADGVSILSRCRADGVHLIESHDGGERREVVLPRQSLHIVAGDLIECIAKPVD